VVWMDECPISFDTAMMLEPARNALIANAWRNECGEICFAWISAAAVYLSTTDAIDPDVSRPRAFLRAARSCARNSGPASRGFALSRRGRLG